MIRIPAIHLTFHLSEPLVVPINYNHALQAFVYSILPQEEASLIHDQGFRHNNRTFKFFCFSRLLGSHSTYDKTTKTLTFHKKITLSISSIIPKLIEKTANFLLLTENLQFHGQTITLDSLEYEEFEVETDTITVKAVSPITAYSTFEKRGGKKITHYFHPKDEVFQYLVEENFIRKYEAFTKKAIESESDIFIIRPIQVQQKDKVVTNYKGTWITGYTGIYELQAKPEYLSFALSTGLAAKNSIGFGMVLPIDSQRYL